MIDVTVPQLGESVTEGTITKWHAKAGDAVTKDQPLVEVATDAGIVIRRGDLDEADGYAAAIREVLDDAELRGRLSLAARDRARAFSWRDSAEKVWQLHADL